MTFRKILAFVLVFCTLGCLCSCGRANDDILFYDEMVEIPAVPTFTVNVIDQKGTPISGVVLSLRKGDNGLTSTTNNDGVATFHLYIESGYRLYVLDCPEGYDYMGFVHIKPGTTKYTFKITKK